jgi:hypothetical protein
MPPRVQAVLLTCRRACASPGFQNGFSSSLRTGGQRVPVQTEPAFPRTSARRRAKACGNIEQESRRLCSNGFAGWMALLMCTDSRSYGQSPRTLSSRTASPTTSRTSRKQARQGPDRSSPPRSRRIFQPVAEEVPPKPAKNSSTPAKSNTNNEGTSMMSPVCWVISQTNRVRQHTKG